MRIFATVRQNFRAGIDRDHRLIEEHAPARIIDEFNPKVTKLSHIPCFLRYQLKRPSHTSNHTDFGMLDLMIVRNMR
jgi:hypothetical protein